MHKRLGILLSVLLVVSLALALVWKGRESPDAPDWLRAPLMPPRATGELVILTVRSATTLHEAPGGYVRESEHNFAGFEHDLAELFAKELGARSRYIVLKSQTELLQALERSVGHIAAAGLAQSDDLKNKLQFGPSYKTIQYQLVYRSADKKPRSLNDADGKKISVISGTPAHGILHELTETYPGIVLDVLPHDSDPEDVLRRVKSNIADFAVVNAGSFSINKRLFPELASAFNIGKELKVAWAYSSAADADLRQSADVFFEKVKRNGTLERLKDRYYGHTSRIQPIDAEAIIDKTQSLLPKLRPFFHEAQELTGIEWRLLAAIGYQESHWNPLAESPTGVRGLMMLTEDTADRMKVKNRLDPRESILGGAKYIGILRDTIPPRIPEPDRTWLALAAYNQGYGHLEDARILTQRLKMNADSWLDVRKAYPLLRETQYNENLKYGFARGDEAVQFVENVRNYYDILSRLERPHEPALSLAGEAASPKPAADARSLWPFADWAK
jgi:membrane-bound lytic murein transglycosylase F